MSKLVLGILFGLLSAGVYAQKDKNIVVDANAEVRAVIGFSAIDISGAFDLYLSQGSEDAVAISASTVEMRQRIRTEVKDNTLQIYFDGKNLNWKNWGNHKLRAYVTFKSLGALEASGACNIIATETIRQAALRIELSGASDFKGEVALDELKIEASGASNAKISGTAGKLQIHATGASHLKAYDLIAENCDTDATGASNIRISVNRELNAKASGGSTIFFKGNGLIRDISTSGGATVKRSSGE